MSRRRCQSVLSSSGLVVPSGITLTSDPSACRLAVVVCSLLMPSRFPRREESCSRVPLRIDDRQQDPLCHPSDNVSGLTRVADDVDELESEGVVKHEVRALEAHPMLREIDARLGSIPLELAAWHQVLITRSLSSVDRRNHAPNPRAISLTAAHASSTCRRSVVVWPIEALMTYRPRSRVWVR